MKSKGRRKMNRELDLSGLKKVFGGLILQLIALIFTGRLTTGLMNGNAASGIVSFVINAAAICIILAGITQLHEASPFFTKAKLPYLIQLALEIALIVWMAILDSRSWSMAEVRQMPRGEIVRMLIIVLIILFVMILARMRSVRAILRGCGHVAEKVNDPMFSLKCVKTWRFWQMSYLLTILAIAGGAAVIVTVLRKTLENGTAGEDLSLTIMVNVSSSVLLVSIIALIVMIIFLIAHIMFLAKVRTTYREYHLEEVKNPEAGMQKPAFADYVERELEGAEPDGGYDPDEEEEYAGEYEEYDDAGEYEEYDDDEEYGEDEADEEEDDVSAEGGEESAGEAKTIGGRKYRRISDDDEEEAAEDVSDIMEITKLFKKNKK